MRVDDAQLLCLSEKARTNGAITGVLMKKSGEPRIQRWQRRYCCIYRNMLFYFDSERSAKPNGVVFLEHCTCLVVPTADEKQYAFSVGFEGLGHRLFMFSTTTAAERIAWMDAIRNARMGDTVKECGALQRKVEMLENQLKQLHNEIGILRHSSVSNTESVFTGSQKSANEKLLSSSLNLPSKKGNNILLTRFLTENSPKMFRSTSLPGCCQMGIVSTEVENELAKIKKLQGYIRGYLRRKKFRKIVHDYINSPLANCKKDRNQIMWSILKSEEEYVDQLDVLVNQFQHPCEIATTSRHPPLSLEACKRIFRNCEMLLMFHKILLQGFHQRIAKWPVVVISDLMEQMIPMMSCYSTYVRDHVHAIEAYFEVSKESNFKQFSEHLHSKPATKGHLLSELLAVPLDRITVNMECVQQLLAHTPPEHVEYISLQSVVKVFEQLEKVVQQEVSSTSNIRQTLEIERRIIGGCPALLDKEQVLVREGVLKLVSTSRSEVSMSPTLNSSTSRHARVCMLFSKHLLITTKHVGFRSSAQCRLAKDIGVIPLAKCSLQSDSYLQNSKVFTLVCSTEQQPNLTISLMGDTVKRKAEWVADLSQCIANERHYKMLADISIGKPVEVDSNKIKFCTYKTGRERMVSSASLNSLLQRLTTVGYSGMTFINTFLTTLPLFTNVHTVMDHLVSSYDQCVKPSLLASDSSFTLPRDPSIPEFITNSLALGTNGRHYTTSPSAKPPQKKTTISGVFFVLKHWTSKHYYDFERDPKLLEKLQTLISKAEQNELLIGGERKALDHVKECLSSVQSEDVDSSLNVIADLLKNQDKVELSPQWLLSFNSEDVAQQLTLIEQSFYLHIEPRELVTNAWSKKNAHELAPNISRFFDNFNRTAYFFCRFILSFSQSEERARGLEYLLEIAQHCLTVGNFSTFMQVMSAIEHTSISRLKKSWYYVSKHAKYQLQELKKISSTDGKFKALRDATRRHSLPCVPYLGPMLNGLCVLSEVNKTYLEPKDGMEQINFNKMHQLNVTISNILHYSQELYEFEYNRDILKSLLWVKEVEEKTLYSLSEQLEAK